MICNGKKRTTIPNVTGNHSMAWKELAEADDLASTITVDAFLKFTTHKMTDMKLRIPERIRTKFRETLMAFKQHKCYDTAYEQLTADQNIIKKSWKMDPRFREHVYRYLLLFDDRSGIEIRACSRYASENHVGAAIFATKDWPKGSRISTLIGCIAELNHEEEVAFLKHRKNDFSVMYSSRKNCSQLWLGPAAYVNHDCQPNCEFTINCDADARMSLESKTDIHKGDEIFIYYGPHFFDTFNSACECFTCELLGRGFFSKFFMDLNKEKVQDLSEPVHAALNSSNSTSFPSALDGSIAAITVSLSNVFPTIAQDTKNGILGNHSTCLSLPRSPNGTLLKGSSAGFARLSMPTSYSLRHTGSRMNRVKARIRAAIDASSSVSDSPTPSSIIRQSVTASPMAGHPDLHKQSNLFDKDICVDTQVNKLDKIEGESIIPLSDVPTDGADANRSHSPRPPILDRAVSLDSMSMPSELSTATCTPDLQSSFYQHTSFGDSFSDTERMPQLSTNLNSSTLDTSHASDQSALTSPARSVEPILGRLFDETQSERWIRSSRISHRMSESKRLTNYDARLIAEANLLPPGSVRRRRVVSDMWNSVHAKRRKSISCDEPKPSSGTGFGQRSVTKRPKCEHASSQQSLPARARIKDSSVVTSTSVCNTVETRLKSLRRKKPFSRGDSEEHPPILTSLDADILSPQFSCSPMSNDLSEAESDDTIPFRFDSENSKPTDYPLCSSPISNSVADVLRKDSLAYALADHDYIKSTAPPAQLSSCARDCEHASRGIFCQRADCSHLAEQFRSASTPPPPTLRPVTPPNPDQSYPILFPNLDHIASPCIPKNSSMLASPLSRHLCSPLSNVLSLSPAVCSLATLFSPKKCSDSLDGSERLTVTLKRVGPKLYEISQRNSLLLFR